MISNRVSSLARMQLLAKLTSSVLERTRPTPEDTPTPRTLDLVEFYNLDETLPRPLRNWRRTVTLLGVMLTHADTGAVVKLMEEMRDRKAQEKLSAFCKAAALPRMAITTIKKAAKAAARPYKPLPPKWLWCWVVR